MKELILDGFRTKGSIQIKSDNPIPCRKGSIKLSEWLVGYYNEKSQFVTVHQIESPVNLEYVQDCFKNNYPLRKMVTLKVETKVSLL